MKSKRYKALDSIRGFALLNMIAYHTIWDLVYIFGWDWHWYQTKWAYVWQQGICWTFIFLSGFCWRLGRHPLKRGMTVFLGGAIISLITIFVMPQNRVVFGVLTLIGSCMIITVLMNEILQKLTPLTGIFISLVLFLITRNVNNGYLGFGALHLLRIPGNLYSNLFTTYLGFPQNGFYSTDYFSIFPWLFLFICAYYLFQYFDERNMTKYLEKSRVEVLAWIGRYSLALYMVHQPLIYLILSLIVDR